MRVLKAPGRTHCSTAAPWRLRTSCPVEATNIIRRAVLAGDISADIGVMAHADMLALRVELFPYEPYAERVWEPRENITAYDAWYVALAESLDAKLVTLDTRLSRAPRPRCRFLAPPDDLMR
jgi:predicted nucleic acid-binding protein